METEKTRIALISFNFLEKQVVESEELQAKGTGRCRNEDRNRLSRGYKKINVINRSHAAFWYRDDGGQMTRLRHGADVKFRLFDRLLSRWEKMAIARVQRT